MKPLVAIATLCALGATAQTLGPAVMLDSPRPWSAVSDQAAPDAVFTGSSFLVVWHDKRDGQGADLWGARIDATGAVSPNQPLLRQPGDQTSPSLALSPTHVVLVALTQVACGNEVLTLVADRQLAPLNTRGDLTTTACTGDRPAIAFNAVANRFLVTWGNHGSGRELHGALLDGMGAVVVPDFVIASAPNGAELSDVVAFESDFVVTWSDDRSGMADVYVVRVSSAGVVGTPTTVSPQVGVKTRPCISTSGAGLVVAWAQSPNIVAQALDTALAPVGAAVTVATGAVTRPTCSETEPGVVAIAFEETLTGGPGLSAATLVGGVLTPLGPVMPRVGYFDRTLARFAATGTARTVLFAQGELSYINGREVLALELSLGAADAGAPDGGLVEISSAAASQARITTAWNGEQYLATWNDNSRFTGYEIVGQLLAPGTGAALVDGGITLTSSSHSSASYPMIAAQADAGVFWLSFGDVGSAGDLMGYVLQRNGTVSPQLELADTSAYVFEHSPEWFGASFVTLFLKSGGIQIERASPTRTVVQPESMLVPTDAGATELATAVGNGVLMGAFIGSGNVYVVRVSEDGGALDPTPLLVSQQLGPEADPAIGSGDTQFLVAWTSPLDGGTSATTERAVFATRLTPGGVVLDTPPLNFGRGTAPSVAWSGTNFAVAWTGGNNILGVRVSPTGQVLEPTPKVLAGSDEIERNGVLVTGPPGEVLLAWESYVPSPPFQSFRAFARVISEAGDGGATGDAGLGSDAGVENDGGVEGDGGVTTDAGVLPEGGPAVEHRELAVGCSCDGTGSGWSLVLALVLAARRRQLRADTRA